MRNLWILTRFLLKSGPGKSNQKSGKKKAFSDGGRIVVYLLLGVCLLPVSVLLFLLGYSGYTFLQPLGLETLLIEFVCAIGMMVIFFYGLPLFLSEYYMDSDLVKLLPLPFTPAQIVGAKGFCCLLNEYYLPKVTVNPYYSSMAKESDDPEARTYLKEKLRQTKWLLDSLERRGSTLRRCAQAILDAQRSFFSGQTVELSPMKLSSLAETLDLHPSTVSRAVRDKYLQCRQGIYPLRYFFSRAVGQQGLSRQAVKQRMLLRFKDEDSSHPLSDQALCDLLAEEGIFLARRTVAKYRIELGIGSSTARRARNRGK